MRQDMYIASLRGGFCVDLGWSIDKSNSTFSWHVLPAIPAQLLVKQVQ